ncbi:MAG: hypothetical protein JWM28_2752 [Chitinophagaceae bacterium]|nr:hypothetical protein [Chitinophagaceae bacterium]
MKKIIQIVILFIIVLSPGFSNSYDLKPHVNNHFKLRSGQENYTDTKSIDIGGMTLVISGSWTAQVFHIVDQLSEWNQYAHRQYIRWASKTLILNQQDRDLLGRHAALRKAHTNSDDFDQSFLTDMSIDDAATASVNAKRLSSSEAVQEQEILSYFSIRLEVLRQLSALQVGSFYKRLEAQKALTGAFVKKLRNFTQTKGKLIVPVFLVVNPEDGSGGGEANGGRLVIEVQEHPDPLSGLIHESLHWLLAPYKEQIKTAADSVGIGWQVLNEGIAYAMAPGLIEDAGAADPLADALVRNVSQGKSSADQYTQFYMTALLIRPLLRSALQNGENINSFLPKAIDKLHKIYGTQPRSKTD